MDLQIKLKCNLFYKKGSAVVIKVSVKNLTSKTQYILKRDSPFSELDSHCFHIKYGDEVIEYDSIYAKLGPVSSKEFMPLLPKQTASVKIRLAQSYLIQKNGIYKISLQHGIYYTRFPDQFEAYLKYQEMQREVFFYFMGKGNIYKTLGMRQKAETYRLMGGVRDNLGDANPPVIDATADLHRAVIKSAHYELDHYLGAVEKELSAAIAPRENLHCEMIFGLFEQTRYDTVKSNMLKIKNALAHNLISYSFDDSNSTAYAYVIGKNLPIYLCNNFVNAPFTGTDSKAGIIFHELSHVFADTDDVVLSPGIQCYGRKNCRELAETRPEEAIKNADSYEFFMETMYSCFQDEIGFDTIDYQELTGDGGPSVLYHPVNNTHELFYLGTDKALHSVIYGKNGFEPVKILLAEDDKPVLAASHPEVVLYLDKVWIFYQTDAANKLFYSILGKNGKWSMPRKVQYKKIEKGLETVYDIEPLSPPKPVVHDNKLKLIYTISNYYEMHMIALKDDVWDQEESIPNSTGLVKEVPHNPAPFLYQNQLHIIYVSRKDGNRMEVAKYNQKKNTWSIITDIPRIKKELIKTEREISAFCAINDVIILYSKSSEDIRVLHLNYEENTKKDMWTDAEDIVNNSPMSFSPSMDSKCAISMDETYFYLFYWNSITKKITVSRKINCF